MGRKSRRKRERRDRTWVEHTEAGRTVHYSEDDSALVEPALREQFERFRQKFGRDPGPDDPIFFDPDADVPQKIAETKIENATVVAMREVGLDPAYIYAYQHTGMLLTEANADLWSDEDLAEWDDAIARYEAMHGNEDV